MNKISMQNIGDILDQIHIPYTYETKDDTIYFSLTMEDEAEDETEVAHHFFRLSIMADTWLCIQEFLLHEIPLTDKPNLSSLYFELLKINDKTKFGKFFIDEDGMLGFGIDIHLSQLNPFLLKDAIDLCLFVIDDQFAPLADRFVSELFETPF